MKRLIITLLPIILFAQSGWIKTYGSEDRRECAVCVRKTDDGGYVILGGDSPRSSSFMWIVKIDSVGDSLWSREYAGVGWEVNEECFAGGWIEQTADGGYIVTGNQNDDLLLMKLKPNGTMLWSKTFGTDNLDCGTHVIQTSDGGYMVTGYFNRHWWSSSSLVVIKTDSQGNENWTVMYEEEPSDSRCYPYYQGNWITKSHEGYIIAGLSGYGGYWLSINLLWLEVDEEGNINWVKTLNGSGHESYLDQAYCVIENQAYNFTITGSIANSYQDCNLFFADLDPAGNITSQKNYGETENWWKTEDVGIALGQTNDGNIIIVGETESFGGSRYQGRLWLLKVERLGDTLWTRLYDGLRGCSIQSTEDGGFIIAGSTIFEDALSDLMILKVDSLGGGVPNTIKPTAVLYPRRDNYNISEITPKANFTNISTEDYPYNLYCHCEIIGMDYHNSDYHDSVLVESLEAWETVTIEFSRHMVTDIGDYEVIFYVTSPGGPEFETDSMTRAFYWDPLQVEEEMVPDVLEVEVLVGLGRQIVFRFNETSSAFTLQIFDASGCKVGELYVPQTGGTISWGSGFSPGVYFIREMEERATTHKVILIR